jgi:hypothetical protein
MPDKSKFEREIDEILEKTGDDLKEIPGKPERPPSSRSFEPFSPSVPKSKRAGRTGGRAGLIKLNSGHLVIAGLVILAIAAFTAFAKVPLAIAGIVLLGIGYALWFRGGAGRGSTSYGGGMFGRGRKPKRPQRNEPEVKYWRGRRIEEKPKRKPESRGGRGKIIDFGSPGDDEDDDGK